MDKRMNDRLEQLLKDMEARQAKEKAEWDALPEEERRRVLDERQKVEDAEKQRELIATFKSKGIPPLFYDSTWENWEANTPDKKKALEAVRRAWRTNLFLAGKAGTGKTHLAMCLTKDGATYRKISSIFREVRSNFDSEQEIINSYGNVKLLIVDEVGRQKFSPFEMNLFFDIIDERYNNILPTTLITNMDEKEFIAEFGTAIVDRLRPSIIRFNWKSYRKKLDIPAPQAEDDIEF
jgi:DNA replication protein DnaC